MRLNLARTVSRSGANGPGDRFVVWTQGCPLACPGCWNRDTWSFAERDRREVADLVAQICTTEGIEGVTFTGGEPFVQAQALAKVAEAVQSTGLSVFVFSGYDIKELSTPDHHALLKHVDVLVAGRYIKDQRDLRLFWRSSQNQHVHFLTDRYSPTDMVHPPDVEVHIKADGTLILTGFPPNEMLGS
jgi:anaerobic ribonucleoside-triphosphate reductase activating protein